MTALRKIVLILTSVALAAAACSGDSAPVSAPAAAVVDASPPGQSEDGPAEDVDGTGAHCIEGVCPTFTGREIFDLHKRPVWSLSMLDDGTIASGDDLTIRLWRLGNSGPQLDQSVVIDNPSFGRTLIDVGDGRVAVTGDAIVIADLATQEILYTLQGSDQVVRVGTDKLATADTQSGLFLWDLADLSAPMAQLDGTVVNLTSTNDMIYFNRNDTILEWDGVNAPSEVFQVDDLWRILPTPQFVYLGDEAGVITIVDRTTWQPVTKLTGLAEFGVTAIVQLPNGTIAASGVSGDIAIWDLAKPDEPRHLTESTGYVKTLLAMPNGVLVAAIDGDDSNPARVALFAT